LVPNGVSNHSEPLCVDGFLSRRTCERILEELSITFWKPSTVLSLRNGDLRTEQSRSRLSQTAHEKWFTPELKRELHKIERRLSALLGSCKGCFEPWQATQYRRGDKFDYHYDAGYWMDASAGDREKTVLIYLNTLNRGGSTHFKKLGIEVAAQAGRLLTWSNLLPDGGCDLRMLHAGLPVFHGVKTILVTWVRRRTIEKCQRSVYEK
jgi:hypothetical protein